MTSQEIIYPSLPSTNSTIERNKYKSPPPPPSSMTPPPTSQSSLLNARTPTPTHSHLSSPPPTIKASLPPSQLSLDSSPSMYSIEQINTATAEELRTMVVEVMAGYREARTAAAHHNLQYTLLTMETSEAMKRTAVELDMTQKEVQVLQAATQRTHLATPTLSASAMPARSSSPADRNNVILDLKNAYQLLDMENDTLRRRLSDAKAALVDRQEVLFEENERLRERIRENRNHINLLRRSTGMPDMTSPTSAFSTPYKAPNNSQPLMTPSRHTTTNSRSQPGIPPSTPKQHRDSAGSDSNQPFAALLLADQVLSQEATTTPSPRHQRAHHQTRQARTSHSLSQMPSTAGAPPSTPVQKQYAPYYTPNALKTPVHQQSQRMSPPQSLGLIATPTPRRPGQGQKLLQRRRESRDSTISAEDADVGAEESKERYSGSRRGMPGKRRMSDEGFAGLSSGGVKSSVKRSKLEGVGLGIGGLLGEPVLL